MRTFALAFVSTLLLSPLSVLAHHPEHAHHHNEHEHSVSKVEEQPKEKAVRIAVTVDIFEADVEYTCQNKEDSCLERHGCYDKDESCGRKHKCEKKKKKCQEDFKCQKDTKKCHYETTDRLGFRCGHKFYNQAKILAAAREACKKIGKNAQKSAFPALHSTYQFDKPGPYVEWPINQNGWIWNKVSKSKRRLVMTMDCAVVGAVVRHKNGDYSKCKYEKH